MYRGGRTLRLFVLILVLSGAGWAAGESAADPAPSWQGKLKAQIAEEDRMEGRTGHSDRVEAAMKRLMDEIAGQNGAHSEHDAGPFRTVGMMQQMDQSFFLGASGVEESVTGGGRCPASASRREYDLSAINVEITLNQWQDNHPGYMYVLTENINHVRAEEKKNKKARENPYDPGAVSTGLQTDFIQPLTLRANQGDCVVIEIWTSVDGFCRLPTGGSYECTSKTGYCSEEEDPSLCSKNRKRQQNLSIFRDLQGDLLSMEARL